MTIRYTYKCPNCSHEYVEQREDSEVTAYITTCNDCGTGEYLEVSQETI